MHYRRVYIEGGCYFFTVITEKRWKIFSDEDNVKRLRAAFKSVMQKLSFVTFWQTSFVFTHDAAQLCTLAHIIRIRSHAALCYMLARAN